MQSGGEAAAAHGAPGTQDRPTVAFRLHGLGDRESTLFKSFLRLLDHRTAQRWVQREEHADVWVVPAGQPLKPLDGALVLSLGEPARGGRFHVAMPIHADELEQRLGQLGSAVLSLRHRAAPAAPGRFRLLRWPPAPLLAHPQRLRLATLMTGRSWTQQALAERAGVPESFCQLFLYDLRHAELLAEEMAGPAAAAHAARHAPAVAPGLLGRIRLRLGLAAQQP